MKKHLKYFWYLVRHKWYVFFACLKYGILWRGITHDLSKFLPSEWPPYVDYYFGDNTTEAKKRFNKAWAKHKKRNPHHWQHWVRMTADGRELILPMPDKYRKEMLANWVGASKAKGKGSDILPWYCENHKKMKLHPETRMWIEEQIFGGKYK